MTDLDDICDEFIVFDSVHDSILALADSIGVMTRKILASRGAGLVAELLDPFSVGRPRSPSRSRA